MRVRCVDQPLPEQAVQIVSGPSEFGFGGGQFGGIREIEHGALGLIVAQEDLGVQARIGF